MKQNTLSTNDNLSIFRTLKQLFDEIPPKSAHRSTTIKPKSTTQIPPKMRTLSVVDVIKTTSTPTPEENFIQPLDNDKKMGKLMIFLKSSAPGSFSKL